MAIWMKIPQVTLWALVCNMTFCILTVSAQNTIAKLPADCVAAPRSAMDAKTGLPNRVIHRPSGITLVLIPAGEFMMGSPASDNMRRPNLEQQHRRVMRQPFYLGETEVTVAQFRRFVASTKYQTDAERGEPLGGHTRGSFASELEGDREWSDIASWRNPFPLLTDYRLRDTHPVVHVSWNDAQRFCAYFGFQLPTEAQWEYAARAGSRTRYFWGDEELKGKGYGNIAGRESKRRFPRRNQLFSFDDGVALLAAVGHYQPNAWKLYDMVGNVLEWVEDSFISCYPGDGADETAAQGGSGRVLRGGSWIDSPPYGRSSVRVTMAEAARRDFIGFRVAKRLEP